MHRRRRDSPQVTRAARTRGRSAARAGDAAGRRDAGDPQAERAARGRHARPPAGAQAEPPRQSLLHDHAAAARPGPADEAAAGRPPSRARAGPRSTSRSRFRRAASSWRRRGTGPRRPTARRAPRPAAGPRRAAPSRAGRARGWHARATRTSALEPGAISKHRAMPSRHDREAAPSTAERRNAGRAIHPKSMPLCVGVMVRHGMRAGVPPQPRATQPVPDARHPLQSEMPVPASPRIRSGESMSTSTQQPRSPTSPASWPALERRRAQGAHVQRASSALSPPAARCSTRTSWPTACWSSARGS